MSPTKARPLIDKLSIPSLPSNLPRKQNRLIIKKSLTMGKISSIEYFRVPPRWLFVKITDDAGNVGWGEASLEGHSQTVEGCLDAWREQYVGLEAKYVNDSLGTGTDANKGSDIEHIWQLSWRKTFYRGGPVFMSALAGIDTALWDLKGTDKFIRL